MDDKTPATMFREGLKDLIALNSAEHFPLNLPLSQL